MEEFECYICGKVISFPTMRFGNACCSDCAEKADAKFTGDIE